MPCSIVQTSIVCERPVARRRLPDGVSFSEEPQVVRWDPVRKLWSLDGFSDHDYKEGEARCARGGVRRGVAVQVSGRRFASLSRRNTH